MPQRNHNQNALKSYSIALAFVAVATLILLPGRGYFAKGQWALLYLLAIMFVATLRGVQAALFAAVLSFLCWNFFFLPPYHTFHVADPKDWLSLLVFLVVGVIVGLQTAKLRQREEEALARERETALLNRFSSHLVSDMSTEQMAGILSKEVTAASGACCCLLFVPDARHALAQVPNDPCQRPDELAVGQMVEWASRESKVVGISDRDGTHSARPAELPVTVSHSFAGFDGARLDLAIPLQTAERRVGVLYVGPKADNKPFTTSDARPLIAISNLAAAFLERKQLERIAMEADALQEADRLKSTFVSSVSHELKTPIASITATITNLLEGDIAWDESNVRAELDAVQADLQRLNNAIGSLLDFSRLESAAWMPKRDWYDIGEILGSTMHAIGEKSRARISFALPDDLPAVYVDFQQLSRVLQNLLENALNYSDENSPVEVGAECDRREVCIWVQDYGPGIDMDERARVFEKFYRGSASSRMPSGTGLGLAVAAEIVKFHGGRIFAEDVDPHGTRMVVCLQREDR